MTAHRLCGLVAVRSKSSFRPHPGTAVCEGVSSTTRRPRGRLPLPTLRARGSLARTRPAGRRPRPEGIAVVPAPAHRRLSPALGTLSTCFRPGVPLPPSSACAGASGFRRSLCATKVTSLGPSSGADGEMRTPRFPGQLRGRAKSRRKCPHAAGVGETYRRGCSRPSVSTMASLKGGSRCLGETSQPTATVIARIYPALLMCQVLWDMLCIHNCILILTTMTKRF